jgi:ribosomal protein S27AE
MERLLVECLNCGDERTLAYPEGRVVASGECGRCGYLGWAPAGQLSEDARRLLREHPLAERRRLQAA